MEVKLIKKNHSEITFYVKGISTTLANAIRRSSFDIPIIAIDELEIYANDSALFDEVLAHRVGLIPIKPTRDIVMEEQCSCNGKGCSKCQLKLKLEAEGARWVYASELKGEGRAIYADMPIVWLDKNQKLKFVAIARKGKATRHAKFQAGLVIYKPVPILKGNNTSYVKLHAEEIQQLCPRKALIVNNNKLLLDAEKCDICLHCTEHSEAGIKIEASDKDFIFYIETYSYLKPEEIFMKAVEVLSGNLTELQKQIRKLK